MRIKPVFLLVSLMVMALTALAALLFSCDRWPALFVFAAGLILCLGVDDDVER